MSGAHAQRLRRLQHRCVVLVRSHYIPLASLWKRTWGIFFVRSTGACMPQAKRQPSRPRGALVYAKLETYFDTPTHPPESATQVRVASES